MNYRQFSFWTKIKDFLNGAGAILQVVLVAAGSEHIWNYLTGAIQIIGLFITIFFDDRNQNGIVDGFEKEITTTTIIKSDSPIIVETEVKKTEL